MSLKVTTRPGRRVYRGAPDPPLKPGACPHCFRVITVAKSGRRRAHNDETGVRCSGSGVAVGDGSTVILDDLPPVAVPPRPVAGVAQSWQPATRTGVPYQGGSDRVPANGRGVCPDCGRHLPLNGDGSLRRHRVRHQDPLAPYCSSALSDSEEGA